MNFFSQVLHADYGKFFRNIRELAQKEHKNSVLLTLDVCFATLTCGSALTDYFNYEFWNKSLKERKKYAVVRDQDRFYQKINDPRYKKTFSVKPNFLKAFAPFVGRDWVYPDGENYEDFEAFWEKHDVFMVKPIDGLGGGGIYKARRSEVGEPKAFYEKLVTERFFLEEVVTQCEALKTMNPASVNTIRVMTHNVDDHPTIFYCALRVGDGSAVVDNFHSGGMAATVDNDTGVVIGKAIDKAGRTFDRHPLSGVAFEGFQVPMWDQVKTMVHEACRLHPEMTVIGWDVAITENGPLLIEGNRRPGFDMVQVLKGHGEKTVLMEIEAQFDAWQERKKAASAEQGDSSR